MSPMSSGCEAEARFRKGTEKSATPTLLTYMCCVTLGKFLGVSEPQLPPLEERLLSRIEARLGEDVLPHKPGASDHNYSPGWNLIPSLAF